MNDLEEKIKSVLRKSVPLERDTTGDWEDAVRRAESAAQETRPARARRSKRSFLARRLVPVLARAAIVFSFALVAPWRHGPGGTVIDRALAAIENGPVLHIVCKTPLGLSYVEIATGRETPLLYTTEVWYDRSRDFKHVATGTEAGGIFKPATSP